MKTNYKPSSVCPDCRYDLSFLAPAEDLLCPECGGRWLGAQAREAALPRKTVAAVFGALVFLFFGPPILGIGLFVLGMVPIMMFSTNSSPWPWILMAFPPLILALYVVAMTFKLWPRSRAVARASPSDSALRVTIVLASLLNVGWVLALGGLLVVMGSLATAGP